MSHRFFSDLSIPSAAAIALWVTQFLQPLLQVLILVLTVAFITLGVLIRWRHLRLLHSSHSFDLTQQTEI